MLTLGEIARRMYSVFHDSLIDMYEASSSDKTAQ
jgi:hypothetical protein